MCVLAQVCSVFIRVPLCLYCSICLCHRMCMCVCAHIQTAFLVKNRMCMCVCAHIQKAFPVICTYVCMFVQISTCVRIHMSYCVHNTHAGVLCRTNQKRANHTRKYTVCTGIIITVCPCMQAYKSETCQSHTQIHSLYRFNYNGLSMHADVHSSRGLNRATMHTYMHFSQVESGDADQKAYTYIHIYIHTSIHFPQVESGMLTRKHILTYIHPYIFRRLNQGTPTRKHMRQWNFRPWLWIHEARHVYMCMFMYVCMHARAQCGASDHLDSSKFVCRLLRSEHHWIREAWHVYMCMYACMHVLSVELETMAPCP